MLNIKLNVGFIFIFLQNFVFMHFFFLFDSSRTPYWCTKTFKRDLDQSPGFTENISGAKHMNVFNDGEKLLL